MKRKQLPRDVNKCEGCKRAVRQEGEGAMCFNCYLAKNVPLPTAQEIEADDYSTDQVARMHERLTALEAENAKLREELKNSWRPIETVPKDREVLLKSAHGSIANGCWCATGWAWPYIHKEPQYWRELAG